MPRRWVVVLGAAVLAFSGCGVALAPSASVPGPTSPPTSSPSTMPPILSPAPSASDVDAWLLVALGDSVPFNSGRDCPGCVGFVDQYGSRLSEDTGHAVEVKNLSAHTGLRLQGLLDELEAAHNELRRETIGDAEVIIVGIGFNDIEFNVDDDPCDGADPWDTRDQAIAAASKYSKACVSAWAETKRPKFTELFRLLAKLRAGQPTILLTYNRYNDSIGWCENRACGWGADTPDVIEASTRLAIEAWNAMVCETATAEGFTCVDVYHAFNGADGTAAAADFLAEDYTHPSQAGNDRIAALLLAAGYAPLVP